MHSHILPGLDDGAPDVATSLRLIAGLGDLGFRKCFATPHVMADLYPNTPPRIAYALMEARAEARARGSSMRLGAAGEYFLDEGFPERLDRGEVLALPGRRVLVEWSALGASPYVTLGLDRLRERGCVPVIAHPERYGDYGVGAWRELRSGGCELQVNLTSLVGAYGRRGREMAGALLTEGLVDFGGSDCHDLRQLTTLSELLADRTAMRLLTGAGLRNRELDAHL